jgi:tripartite-type tricarboxylate transporter receptor subunit TctC
MRIAATRRLLAGVASAILLAAAGSVAAQPYPNKPVRIMVGAPPGGGTDVIARMLADKFGESLKQSFIVENRPGASNTIAADLTARATPDGYTLLAATNTGQAIAPHLLKLQFDPLKQLQPLGLIVVVPNVLVVNAGSDLKDVQSLVAQAKAAPGKFRYASSGIGSTQHIAGEAFDLATGVKTTHVPYKGSSQAHVDLMSGQVEMMFDTTSSAMPHIKSGKLRPLAVTTPQRSPELPDVPTLVELGIKGADVTTWYGLFVTGGTPKPIVDTLHAELQRVLKLPDVQAKLKGLGGEVGTLTLDQFSDMNKREFESYGKLIKAAGIKVE